MDDADADRAKLTKALARLVASQRQIDDARKGVHRHASALLDHHRHAVRVASDHLAGSDNPLVARYHRARVTDAARAAAVALRAEGSDE